MNPDPSLPLTGKTIVITRSQDQQAEARLLFEAAGAQVLDMPALVIGPPDDWTPLDDVLLELDTFHWIIFSSVNGVKSFQQRLDLIHSSLSSLPKSLKIAAVGRKTAHFLQSLDVQPDFVPPKFVADSLIEHFPVSALGLNFLLPRVQSGGRTFLSQALRSAGANVEEVPAYESRCPDDIPLKTITAFKNHTVDMLIFTSAKTVAHTYQLAQKIFGLEFRDIFLGVKIVSIGPQTTISCKKYFKKLDQEASQHDLDGLLNASIDLSRKN